MTTDADAFTSAFYEEGLAGGTWRQMRWLGTPICKLPLDLWIYQELVAETRPDIIIETGTHAGGSALYFAHLCDLLDHGRVVTIDIDVSPGRPEHPRITYLHGSSVDPTVIDQVRGLARGRAMVALDSDHHADHVGAEMEAYAPVVAPGCYLVVEDTIVNGHPVEPKWGPGPWEAVEAFLSAHAEFEVDEGCERLLATFNRRGYLRRL